MKTETWNIERLVPYARNPRKNDGAVDKVAASLKEFGFRQPIVVDCEGVIIAGHTRYKAAKKLGMAEVPVHIATELTPAQVKAYRIADNKVGELAEWDDELLALEIEDLKLEDYDIELTGFDMDELPGDGANEEVDAEPQIDKAEELRAKWGVKQGQLWELGDHRLLCGDSTKKEDVERVMEGKVADILLTDPPYGMRLDADFSKMPRGGKTYAPVIGDDADFDFEPIFSLWKCKRMAVWGGGWFYQTLPKGGSWLVWDKQPQHTVAGPQNHFEECWVWPHRKRIIIRHLWTGFTAKEAGQDRVHPTQKPIAVMVELAKFMGEWDTCADPFSGSGTTIIACEQLGRKCRAIEISPAYVAVALQRWADATGKTPRLIE